MRIANPRISGHFIGPRQLAVLLWESPEPRFAVLYVPPAFEEMNKCRRMAAIAARELAGLGGQIALLDLTGTGDSGGEHRDATWQRWHDDVAIAWEWLGRRARLPLILWGTRLGAVIAAQAVANHGVGASALLLWQPVTSGSTFFSQLLRWADAQQVTGIPGDAANSRRLRDDLSAGRAIQLAGYDVHPELAAGIASADLAGLAIKCPVIWRETSISDAAASISPAAQRVVAAWQPRDVRIDILGVRGPSFWSTVEIEDAPALVASTAAAVASHLERSCERVG